MVRPIRRARHGRARTSALLTECLQWVVAMAVILVLGLAETAAQVQVTASVDSTEYRIGEWIRVRVALSPNVESAQLVARDSAGLFEVMKVEQTDRQAWIVQVTTLDTGRLVLPPLEVAYRQAGDTARHTAFSNSLAFYISAPTVNLQDDIRDIKPPFDAPWLFEDVLPYLITLLIMLCVAAVFYYWRAKRRKGDEPQAEYKPSVAPHTLALMQLRELEEKRLWQQGYVKVYYSEVTKIIRRFFEGRFGIPALELTSDEVMQRLQTLNEAEGMRKQLQTFFTTADLVKFARYEPTPEENNHELTLAYEIVRSMVPKPAVLASTEEESIGVR